jgi:CBS domain-containing protein
MQVHTILQEKGSWVATIRPSDSIAEAARSLGEHDIGALVVSENGTTIDGILSERDIVRALADPEVLDQRVDSLMTPEVMTCAPDATVVSLMETMTENRIRHVPIVDGDQLAGIISIGDVVKHRVQELQVEAQTLHEYLETGR